MADAAATPKRRRLHICGGLRQAWGERSLEPRPHIRGAAGTAWKIIGLLERGHGAYCAYLVKVGRAMAGDHGWTTRASDYHLEGASVH